ncbi:MAG TPA: hypothetical protein ENF19_02500 [Candidatus Bathyarchaeota archaeon]|nr:hypothetical protein [Candidatus Bathyarchaeota archaeon]
MTALAQPPRLSEKEMEFLRMVASSGHRQVSQESLKRRLLEQGVLTEDEFKEVKKRLLFSGIIGIVYGNITLERDLNELEL